MGMELIDPLHEIQNSQVTACLRDLLAGKNKFECVLFSQIESLYLKEDVSPELQQCPLFLDDWLPFEDSETLQRLNAASKKYRINPIVNQFWWQDRREAINADYPCASFYQSAV